MTNTELEQKIKELEDRIKEVEHRAINAVSTTYIMGGIPTIQPSPY